MMPNISLRLTRSASYGTRSLLKKKMPRNIRLPRTLMTIAHQRYSVVEMVPSIPAPPGTHRHTAGTTTYGAACPIDLRVPEKPIRLFLSVGFGVMTADMPCDGTSPKVMATDHKVVVTNM